MLYQFGSTSPPVALLQKNASFARLDTGVTVTTLMHAVPSGPGQPLDASVTVVGLTDSVRLTVGGAEHAPAISTSGGVHDGAGGLPGEDGGLTDGGGAGVFTCTTMLVDASPPMPVHTSV